jgi:hypothetical protein
MLGLGVLSAGVVLMLLIAFVGLSVRRLVRWMRGESQPHTGWQDLRHSAATTVWKHYQTRYQHSRNSNRGAVVDVQDIDFKETPRPSAHQGDVGRLPS